jgi:hypothetical protein
VVLHEALTCTDKVLGGIMLENKVMKRYEGRELNVDQLCKLVSELNVQFAQETHKLIQEILKNQETIKLYEETLSQIANYEHKEGLKFGLGVIQSIKDMALKSLEKTKQQKSIQQEDSK